MGPTWRWNRERGAAPLFCPAAHAGGAARLHGHGGHGPTGRRRRKQGRAGQGAGPSGGGGGLRAAPPRIGQGTRGADGGAQEQGGGAAFLAGVGWGSGKEGLE